MGKQAGELMLRRVHEVVRAADLFAEFEAAEHFSLRVENEPYMALVIESWPAADPLMQERRRVLVGHYFTEQGRSFADPELEMTDAGFPVRLRQWGLGVNPIIKRLLRRFADSGDQSLTTRIPPCFRSHI